MDITLSFGHELANRYTCEAQSKYNNIYMYYYCWSLISSLYQKGSMKMQRTWYTFAKTGNPDNELIPEWKPYSETDRNVMITDTVEWTLEKNLNEDKQSVLSVIRPAGEQ